MVNRFFAYLLLFVFCLPAMGRAACTGTDLIETLPPDQALALRTSAAQHPFADGLLWRAERDGAVVHLVGTLHFHDPRQDALLDRIAPLIDTAGSVFLELAGGDDKRLQQHIAQNPELAFIVEGPTLPMLLPEADWDRLRDAMAQRGYPGFLVAKMRPWMVMLNLGTARCVLEALQAGKHGVDQAIIRHAVASGKTPRRLEPFDTALKMFDSITPEEQLEMLSLSLYAEALNPNDQAITLANAYYRQEIRLLWEWGLTLALQQPGYRVEQVMTDMARFETIILTDRNLSWMPHILNAAEQSEVLVAVGALHLSGETGLLTLLEQEGFKITSLALHP
jgi:uncharacterized protein YbaP (TraB family)